MGVTKSHRWKEHIECCNEDEDIFSRLRAEVGSSRLKADNPSRRGYQNVNKKAFTVETKFNKGRGISTSKTYEVPKKHPNKPPRKYFFKEDKFESLLELLLK